MKKIFLACVLLSIAYSCSKDEKEDYKLTQEEFVGDWELVKATGELHVSWIDTSAVYDLSECNTIGSMEIKDGGEYFYDLPEYIYNVCDFESRAFGYVIDNGEVIVENPSSLFNDYHHSFKMKDANTLQYKVEIIEHGKLVVKNAYTLERY